MKSIYIAGPYSAGSKKQIDANIHSAAKVASYYAKRGYAVFCPHTMMTQIDREFNGDGVLTWQYYLETDIYWLSKCDAVHMLRGWRDSKGASLEYMVAKALGLEILGEIT